MNALALSLVNALAITPEAAHLNRLELLLARAKSLDCTGAIVDVRGEQVLSLSVFHGTRLLGHLHLEVDEMGNESWSLSTQCNALTGLPMQADWLLEGAKRVREVFNALVAP